MAIGRQHNHFVITNTALPYRSGFNITDTDLAYEGGQNILTSQYKFAERRPGFAAYESTPTTFTNNIRRIYTWRRWNGAFFIMLNEVSGTQSIIYKLQVGTDTTFGSAIFTSSTAEPFDFIAANNHVFFGNGTDMQKYDGTTVTNWGIAAPSAAPTVNTFRPPTAAAGTNWTTPTNALASDDAYATYTTTTQDDLRLTGFGFALPTGATVVGVEVEIEGNATDPTTANRQIRVGLTKDGTALAGTRKTGITLNENVDGTTIQGSATDLWGTTFTEAEIEASTFGVLLSDNDVTGAGTLKIDRVRVRVAFSQGITATSGYKYVYAYGNSTTGHISTRSAVAASTGAFTNNQIEIGVTASADAQVNRIHVYRSTDGGGGMYFEITGSPFANATATVQDRTLDTNLSTETSSDLTMNDRPPGARGFVWFNNRIWMFRNNEVWYTGWEEINNGVEEECVPSGTGGNFWAFEGEVMGLGVTSDAVLVFTATFVHRLEGDTRDTFSRRNFASHLGCRERAAVASFGRLVAWLDTSDQVYITDGSEAVNISLDINADINGIDHTQASLSIHNDGNNQWLCLLDGEDSRLRVFDFETNQWMPPWTVGGRAIFSGESAVGVVDLFVGHSSRRLLRRHAAAYADNGAAYTAHLVLGLLPTAPEGKPGLPSVLDYAAYETNAVNPTQVRAVFDDDPTVANPAYNNGEIVDDTLRVQGANLQEKRAYFRNSSPARRVSLRFDWPAATTNFRLYSADLAVLVTA